MRREVRLEVVYPHPPEKVWNALTDRKALEKWLLPNDFTPRLGHRFRFIKETPGSRKRKEVQCEVVELEAPRRLAYTWRSDPDDPPELVCWTLEPVEAGTCLRLEHLSLEEAPATLTASLDPQWTMRLHSRLAAFLNGEALRRSDAESLRQGRHRALESRSSQGNLRRIGIVRFFPAGNNAKTPQRLIASESEKTHA